MVNLLMHICFTRPQRVDNLTATPFSLGHRTYCVEVIAHALISSGHFYLHGLTLIPAWISSYIRYKVWHEINYLFLNSNCATVEV